MSNQQKLLVVSNKFSVNDWRHVVLVVSETTHTITARHVIMIDSAGTIFAGAMASETMTLNKNSWQVLYEIETIDAVLPPECIQ